MMGTWKHAPEMAAMLRGCDLMQLPDEIAEFMDLNCAI